MTIVTFSRQLDLQSQLQPNRCRVMVVPKRGQISRHLFADLREKLRELAPDIVHTHLFGADVWGRVAARRLGIPIVTTEHNINRSEGVVKTAIKRWLRATTHIYTAPSQAVADYMRRAYGVGEVRIIRHGIHLPTFTAIRARKAYSQPPRLLILGRLVPQKGHIIALKALSQLKQTDWVLRIIGDGPELTTLRQLVTRLQLQKQVEFLPATTAVAEAYRWADAVLVPSFWEGLGLVAMEAMAAGKPVIAADTGGLSELITDRETGYLAAAGNVAAWTQTLQEVLSSAAAALHIGRSARAYAVEHFRHDSMVAAYEAIYQSLADAYADTASS